MAYAKSKKLGQYSASRPHPICRLKNGQSLDCTRFKTPLEITAVELNNLKLKGMGNSYSQSTLPWQAKLEVLINGGKKI